MIGLLNHYTDLNHPDIKSFIQILIDTFMSLKKEEVDEPYLLDSTFIEVALKIAKQTKSSCILAPFFYQLPFETIKDQLPLIVI